MNFENLLAGAALSLTKLVSNRNRYFTEIGVQSKSVPNQNRYPIKIGVQSKSVPNQNRCPIKIGTQSKSVPNQNRCPIKICAQSKLVPNQNRCPIKLIDIQLQNRYSSKSVSYQNLLGNGIITAKSFINAFV